VSEEFERDLARCNAELQAARDELLAVVGGLRDSDLDRAPRGHWPARQILRHIVWHEQVYVRYIAHLRGGGTDGEMPDFTPASVDDALRLLGESRQAIADGTKGIDEETFYRLGNLGYEEYSVLSMLENEANHEREHAAQITKTLVS
jgi:hypothetical protein